MSISREYKVKEYINLTEELYSKALKNNGKDKLRVYLTGYHKKYLPGYLCVRKILSKWRETYKNKIIRGDQASRLFLHLTRFSSFDDTLPDLSLSLDNFKKAVRDKHIEWLNSIS